MIGCGFFGDKQPTPEQANELPHWVSITRLSNLLGVSRNTISTAVKRAWANREPWVKKEKAEDGSPHYYLINTQHEMYLSHQERWKQNKTLRAALLGEVTPACSHAGHSLFHPLSAKNASLPSDITVPLFWYGQKSSQEVLQQWPHFRQWLYAHGIQIFQNLLADEKQKKTWEWRWGELHGEGFDSDEEAIVAALQSHFDANEREYEEQEDTPFFHMLEQQERQEPQPRFSWFRKNG